MDRVEKFEATMTVCELDVQFGIVGLQLSC